MACLVLHSHQGAAGHSSGRPTGPGRQACAGPPAGSCARACPSVSVAGPDPGSGGPLRPGRDSMRKGTAVCPGDGRPRGSLGCPGTIGRRRAAEILLTLGRPLGGRPGPAPRTDPLELTPWSCAPSPDPLPSTSVDRAEDRAAGFCAGRKGERRGPRHEEDAVRRLILHWAVHRAAAQGAGRSRFSAPAPQRPFSRRSTTRSGRAPGRGLLPPCVVRSRSWREAAVPG